MLKVATCFLIVTLLTGADTAGDVRGQSDAATATSAVVARGDVVPGTQRMQLRIYTINRGKLDEFIHAWRNGVLPLRQKFGFKVERAWVIRERNEFVWLVTYVGPGDWETAEKAYYASAQRAAVAPDPVQFIARPEQWFIESVLAPP